MLRGLLMAGCLGALAGCATTETRTVTLPEAALPRSSWIGHDVTDVISKWGPAAERQPDGRGGEILVYDKTQSVMIETPPNVDLPAAPKKTTPIQKVLARFWVDESRKVYKIWFADEVYEKGQDTVPPGKGDSE